MIGDLSKNMDIIAFLIIQMVDLVLVILLEADKFQVVLRKILEHQYLNILEGLMK
jgi:hypothetical protein